MSTDTCTHESCDTNVATSEPASTSTKLKATIVVLSDPKSGSQEESLGRVFNALAAAYDFKQRGDDVRLQFQGAGTRWIGQLNEEDHPAHKLFKEVEDTVAGVSCGCADVFGGSEEATASGFDLITDNPVPGTTGMASLASVVREGRTVLTF
ncbi:MAG: DsrE family protein [Pirellulales bacterium]|nr:DsrE family protein [Pirellulales bacterium]